MAPIRCVSCGQQRPRHIAGSAFELKYFSLGDTTVESPNKMFFCSASCYLDRQFLKEVQRHAKEPHRELTVSTAMADENLLGSINELQPHYDEITEYYNKGYGLWKFRQRNGITDPYASNRREDGSVIDFPPGFEPVAPARYDNKINWADESGDGVLVIPE